MKLKKLILCGCILGLLCGCQLKKENTEGTFETERLTGKILEVGYESDEIEEANMDYSEIFAKLVFGVSKEEAEQYRVDNDYGELYETKEIFWSDYVTRFELYTTTYALGNAYEQLKQKDNYNYFSLYCDYQWRSNITQEEELDNCSKEEVLNICKPYADAMGLNDTDKYYVETYALTLETLERVGNDYKIPDENFVYYTIKEIEEAKEAGVAEDIIADMEFSRMFATKDKTGLVWEKKHEAIVVVYYALIDGITIKAPAEDGVRTMMVYVPYYDKIVSIRGNKAFSKIEVREEVEIISKQEAIDIALLELGNACTVNDVTYTYVQDIENDFTEYAQTVLYPAWRIDYTIGIKNDSIWIQAVDGYKWEI